MHVYLRLKVIRMSMLAMLARMKPGVPRIYDRTIESTRNTTEKTNSR